MGRWRTVVEHVTQVRIAALAADLDAPHAVTAIFDLEDVVAIVRLKKARPSSARVELRVGLEQRQTAEPARIDAGFLVVEEHATAGALGSVMKDHVALFVGEIRSECFDAIGCETSQV